MTETLDFVISTIIKSIRITKPIKSISLKYLFNTISSKTKNVLTTMTHAGAFSNQITYIGYIFCGVFNLKLK